MTRYRLPPAAIAAASLLAVAACTQVAAPPPAPVPTAARPDRGAQLIQHYGCGSCHTIPGVARADGTVGPPLTNFASRSYIAGKLPNNAGNLQRWIQSPQSVVPGNAMPDLGVSDADARDIVAYLYTLR